MNSLQKEMIETLGKLREQDSIPLFFAEDEWGVTIFSDAFFDAWKIADSVFFLQITLNF